MLSRLAAAAALSTFATCASADIQRAEPQRNMQTVLSALDRDFGMTPSSMLFAEPCDPDREPGNAYCQVRVNDMQVRAYGSIVSVLYSSTRTVEDVGTLCARVLHALAPSLGPDAAMSAMLASVERAAGTPDRRAKSEVADVFVTIDIGETAFDCSFAPAS